MMASCESPKCQGSGSDEENRTPSPTEGDGCILDETDAKELEKIVKEEKDNYAVLMGKLHEQRELEEHRKQENLKKWLSDTLVKTGLYSEFLMKKMEQENAAAMSWNSQQDPPRPKGRAGKRKSGKAGAPQKGAKRQRLEGATMDGNEEDDLVIQYRADDHDENDRDEGNVQRHVANFKPPSYLTGGTLRPYQIEGFLWLKAQYENGINGILADEMGLGKTIQFISLTCHLVENKIPGPFLVIAPMSTLPNWVSEYNRFAPELPCIMYHAEKSERVALRKKLTQSVKVRGENVLPVVVTSYQLAMIDAKYLNKIDWRYIVIDEGHRIKNMHCRLVMELKKYNSCNRLLLTGTPLQNNLKELWSLLNFLLPEVFDKVEDFESYFDFTALLSSSAEEEVIDSEMKRQTLNQLHKILTPFLLRRVKANVELSIPPKKEVLVYCPMTDAQMLFYRSALDQTISQMSIYGKTREEEEKEALEAKPVNRRGGRSRTSGQRINYAVFDDDDTFFEAMNELGVETFREKSPKKNSVDPNEEQVEENDDDGKLGDAAASGSGQWDWLLKPKGVGSLQEKVPGLPATVERNVPLTSLLTILRKACMHLYLLEYPLVPETGDYRVDEGLVRESGKMRMLDRMLGELKKRGHRVLLFSQWTSMLDIIEQYCGLRGHSLRRLDGATNLQGRMDGMKEFNEDDSIFLYLITTRAGGLGINLTSADTVIFFDSDWNPQSDLQAQDRCHRIGQTKPVVVYRLVSRGTVDEKMIQRATQKRRLEKMVIHSKKFKSANDVKKSQISLSADELLELLRHCDHAEVFRSGDGADEGVISDADLTLLLDRSAMDPTAKQEVRSSSTATSAKSCNVFKVLQTD